MGTAEQPELLRHLAAVLTGNRIPGFSRIGAVIAL
jgi:hypothetical protein